MPHRSPSPLNGLTGLRLLERGHEVDDAVLLLPTREPSSATTASSNSAASTFSAFAPTTNTRKYPPGLPGESGNVALNIYDLGRSTGSQAINKVLGHVGMGVFHCGVEIYGKEWSFRRSVQGSGIFACRPHCCPGHHFSESMPMGHVRINKAEVLRLISSMSRGWSGAQYNTLRRNCCHFSREFCDRLEVNADFPSRILAAAEAAAQIEEAGAECWASMSSPQARKGSICLLRCCRQGPPVDEDEENEDIHVVEKLPVQTIRPDFSDVWEMRKPKRRF
eukprot:CAMPEP_0172742250 /NCGR_PEP_ID=MMETSP1074-20121228/129058_1 /TAXON_ID=2916 /ORGANISM="Ceratium fusus, Strain PA161109" /LENGTH=277 /DNA_ID=CAMNT_0013572759 /DNA_START=379 /DNA_END=1212 /DNA_ORIENTATION=+